MCFYSLLFIFSLVKHSSQLWMCQFCVKQTLFAERGGRARGERHTVPPYTERMVLFELALERLEVELICWKRPRYDVLTSLDALKIY